jgi:actin
MTTLWQHVYSTELSTPPEGHPVLMTEAAFPRKEKRQVGAPPHSAALTPARRETLTQVVFESLRAPAFYAANSAPLALYASGRVTGMVLESGGQSTRTVGVREGLVVPLTARDVSYAGDDLTNLLEKRLDDQGYVFRTAADREIVRDMKEKLGYVAEDVGLEVETWRKESGKGIQRDYELPDGRVITVGSERFMVPEAMLVESIIGLDSGSFCTHLWESIRRCDVDIQGHMLENIVLVCLIFWNFPSIGTVRG